MKAEALIRAMSGLEISRARQLVEPLEAAMIEGKITTQRRAAAWLAQLGHESVSLRYMEEIADGSAYEGRRDLGNTEPGDGRRYKGRGPIQLTGRSNYRSAGTALHLPLESNPTMAARPDVGFRVAVWYWTSRDLNAYCDRGDFVGLTRAINGGENGLADRQQRWASCKALGAAILPEKPDPVKRLPKHERKIVYAMRRARSRARTARTTRKRAAWLVEVARLRRAQVRCRVQMRRLRRGAAKTGWDKDGKGLRYRLLKRALAGKL